MNYIAVLILLIVTFSFQTQASDNKNYKTSLLNAQQHFQNKDYQQAVTEYQRSYQLEPLDSTLYNIAVCHFKLKQWPQALAAFQQLQENQPDSELTAYNIAVVQKQQGDHQQAFKTFQYLTDNAQDLDIALLAEQQLVQNPNSDYTNTETRQKNEPSQWQHIVNVQLGNESNIVLPDGENFTEQSDQFIDYMYSTSWLSSDNIANAWLADFTYYGSKYSEAESYEVSMYALSVRKYFTPESLPQTRFYLAAGYESIELSSLDYLDTVNLKFGMRHWLSNKEKLKVELNYRDIEEGDERFNNLAGSSIRAKLTWQQYLENGYWKLGGKYQIDDKNDRILEDEFISYSADRLSFFVGRYWEYQAWELDILGEYRISEYHDNNTYDGVEDALREDDKLFLSSTITYNFDDSLSISAELDFTDNTSTLAENEYDQTTFSVGATWLF